MENESILSIFEEITKNCSQKIIQSYSKKLGKKLSFNSSKDVEYLRDITFLLYIFGYIDYVKRIFNMLDNNEQNINEKFGYINQLIHQIWGLEIRLLREDNNNEKINKIIVKIDKWLRGCGLSEEKENRRRERSILWEEERKSDVSRSRMVKDYLQQNQIKDANKARLLGICGLIGLSETGLYPVLNENKEKIETIISEYKEEIIKTSK